MGGRLKSIGRTATRHVFKIYDTFVHCKPDPTPDPRRDCRRTPYSPPTQAPPKRPSTFGSCINMSACQECRPRSPEFGEYYSSVLDEITFFFFFVFCSPPGVILIYYYCVFLKIRRYFPDADHKKKKTYLYIYTTRWVLRRQ